MIMETIKEGEYVIPAELTARVCQGKVIVTKRISRRLDENDVRCRNCKFFIRGHAKTNYYLTDVCQKMPKDIEGYYYSVSPYRKPCDKFEPMESGVSE